MYRRIFFSEFNLSLIINFISVLNQMHTSVMMQILFKIKRSHDLKRQNKIIHHKDTKEKAAPEKKSDCMKWRKNKKD